MTYLKFKNFILFLGSQEQHIWIYFLNFFYKIITYNFQHITMNIDI